MFYSTTKGISFGIFYKFQFSWVSRFQLGKSTSGSASELHKLPTFHFISAENFPKERKLSIKLNVNVIWLVFYA